MSYKEHESTCEVAEGSKSWCELPVGVLVLMVNKKKGDVALRSEVSLLGVRCSSLSLESNMFECDSREQDLGGEWERHFLKACHFHSMPVSVWKSTVADLRLFQDQNS